MADEMHHKGKSLEDLLQTSTSTQLMIEATQAADKELQPEKKKVWDLSQPLEDQEEMESSGARNHTFEFPCPYCGKTGDQNMCEIDIPGFRRCLIMAYVCDYCGARSNEVKPAGPIGEKARKWTLKVECDEDLNRDILKADSAALEIPELDFKLEMGSLGGVFTTVEGLLKKMAEELSEKFPFVGDSAIQERKQVLVNLMECLQAYSNGQNLPFTLIVDDAADHSHIGRRGGETLLFLTQPEKAKEKLLKAPEDSQLSSFHYERSDEQNDELGLKDMKVVDY